MSRASEDWSEKMFAVIKSDNLYLHERTIAEVLSVSLGMDCDIDRVVTTGKIVWSRHDSCC